LSTLIDFVLHIDAHLVSIVNAFGDWSYLILFAIIFIETGAVILPFLPGDSLLFAASALAANAQYHLSVELFIILFLIACISGDSLNFFIGHKVGKSISKHPLLNRLIDQNSLQRAELFFEKHGASAIILARFMPIIRTFAPFVSAGSGFAYRKFLPYSLIGCFSWVFICCLSGFFFGNLPFVKAHFSAIILAIIVVTLIPAMVGFIKSRISGTKA
jgi:membrane-associated protein